MGQVNQTLLDDWLRVQDADYRQRERRTIVKLPCCGSSIEITADQEGFDQHIICPNHLCQKRHLLTWGIKPKIQSEVPLDPI